MLCSLGIHCRQTLWEISRICEKLDDVKIKTLNLSALLAPCQGGRGSVLSLQGLGGDTNPSRSAWLGLGVLRVSPGDLQCGGTWKPCPLCAPDYPALHAPIQAALPHRAGRWPLQCPLEHLPGVQLPWDCLHLCHCLPERAGTVCRLCFWTCCEMLAVKPL